jgi:hypothetical protein
MVGLFSGKAMQLAAPPAGAAFREVVIVDKGEGHCFGLRPLLVHLCEALAEPKREPLSLRLLERAIY